MNSDILTNKAIIEFKGDPSVGIFPRVYHMELPTDVNSATEGWDKDSKEEVRKKIKELYEHLDNEDKCTVYFDTDSTEEPQDDNDTFIDGDGIRRMRTAPFEPYDREISGQ